MKGNYAPSWYEDTKKYYHYAITSHPLGIRDYAKDGTVTFEEHTVVSDGEDNTWVEHTCVNDKIPKN